MYVIMLLNVPVNSKAHVRMHTCDIFLSMCLFYVFVRHVAEKKNKDTSEREWENKLLPIHNLSETVFFRISLF